VQIDRVTQLLEEEGVRKFSAAFGALLDSLESKRRAPLPSALDRQSLNLGSLEPSLQRRVAHLGTASFGRRLWERDADLWKINPRGPWGSPPALGWLNVADKMEESVGELERFAAEIQSEGFKQVLHIGMGGSSLAAMVLAGAFRPSRLPVFILDTTDPAAIANLESRLELRETLFLLASKSGTTAETVAHGEYFFQKLHASHNSRAGKSFVAITDPGTPLARLAAEREFRRTFLNFSDIGGRYSALSYFGLVPAALQGLDVEQLLSRALQMAQACAGCVEPAGNPGLLLGAALGEAGRSGKDKVTFVVPPELNLMGMWLEQLLAESTGKRGKGLLPVAGEDLGPPSAYGGDRVFVQLQLGQGPDAGEASRVPELQRAGHPVITVRMTDPYDLSQEFFRWEIATATAGAVLRINPFDQPNVEESKSNTRRLLQQMGTGSMREESAPTTIENGLAFFAPPEAEPSSSPVRDLLAQAKRGSYFAIQAYLPEEENTRRELQAIRLAVRDRFWIATTVGFGPRFLHSTGQYHKGGPNHGLFLQLTADDLTDLPIPGRSYSFGMLKKAQALGDLLALRRHRRRVLRVHLGKDVAGGLESLAEVVRKALAD